MSILGGAGYIVLKKEPKKKRKKKEKKRGRISPVEETLLQAVYWAGVRVFTDFFTSIVATAVSAAGVAPGITYTVF